MSCTGSPECFRRAEWARPSQRSELNRTVVRKAGNHVACHRDPARAAKRVLRLLRGATPRGHRVQRVRQDGKGAYIGARVFPVLAIGFGLVSRWCWRSAGVTRPAADRVTPEIG